MPRITPFSVGQVWRSVRHPNPYMYQGFFWVIAEPDLDKGWPKPEEKRVKMIYDPYGPNYHSGNNRRKETPEFFTFSHAHIKKFSKPFDVGTFNKCQEFDKALVKKLEEKDAMLDRNFNFERDQSRFRGLEDEAWVIWGNLHKLIMGEADWH